MDCNCQTLILTFQSAKIPIFLLLYWFWMKVWLFISVAAQVATCVQSPQAGPSLTPSSPPVQSVALRPCPPCPNLSGPCLVSGLGSDYIRTFLPCFLLLGAWKSGDETFNNAWWRRGEARHADHWGGDFWILKSEATSHPLFFLRPLVSSNLFLTEKYTQYIWKS